MTPPALSQHICRSRASMVLLGHARATGAAIRSSRPFHSDTGSVAGLGWFRPASHRSAAMDPDGALTLLPLARQTPSSGLTVPGRIA
jgi:hypothetical protein